MDAMQPTTGTLADGGPDSQVYVDIDPHVTVAIACLVIALLVAFFVVVISTMGKKNDGP